MSALPTGQPASPGPVRSATPTVHQRLCEAADDYRARFGRSMPHRQREVLERLLRCRTAALGAHVYRCECGQFHHCYHSCNDRHCPLCGRRDADEWLARQSKRLLLPAPFFLVTFTVPETLRQFLRSHPQPGLDLLFACSAQALQDIAANPRHLGAQLGMLGVLHTWSRTLIYHPHIHFLVPGGGLTPDGRQWKSTCQGFLLPLKPLGLHVKNLFEQRLKTAHPELHAQVPEEVWRRHWNVNIRDAGSGENALRYLSRYVFKTATGNRPVPALPDGRLVWNYTDSRTGRPASLTLAPEEFMRRFLQHVLPRNFARVRTFGWLHPAAKTRGNRVRALLGVPPVLSEAEQAAWQTQTPDAQNTVPKEPQTAGAEAATHEKAPRCPRCGQAMTLHSVWHPGQPVTILRALPTVADG